MKNLFLALFLLLFCAGQVDALAPMNKNTIKEAQEYGIMRYQEDIPDFAKPWCVYEETSKALDLSGERVYVYTPYYLVALNARERLISSQTINIVDGEMIVQEFGDILPVCVVVYIEDAEKVKSKISAFIRQGEKTAAAYEVEIQDVAVVQTKVIREKKIQPAKENKPVAPRWERAPADKKEQKKPERGKPEKNADKGKEKAADPGENEDLPPEATPEPIFVEKTIPLLHRVQLFFYFDARQIRMSGQAALVVNMQKERERRFNFNFSAIN
jgi:hypothetical protein